MVMGPTPPGTGVIRPSSSGGGADVAGEAGGGAVDADVDDGGAGLDVFGADEAAYAGGDHEDVGAPGHYGKVGGVTAWRWAMVTVASWSRRSWAMGRPTSWDRPRTTAWVPLVWALSA